MKNDELTAEKKAAIKELLKITEAAQSSETAMNLIIAQMVGMMKELEEIDDLETFDLMEKEARTLIHEEIVVKESLNLLIYSLYHKYLTLEEINGLIQFNKTPLGQKMISINPKIVRESMKIGQVWGQKLNLKFRERTSKILKKEKEN